MSKQLRFRRVLQLTKLLLSASARAPRPTIERVLNALNNRIDDFPSARSARTEFKNLQQNEGESIQEFSRRVRKLGEAANAHLNSSGGQEANEDAFIDGLIDSEIR